jgi:dihydroxyacetone kinase
MMRCALKKIINDGQNVVEEMLTGYLAAYSRYDEQVGDRN